MSEYEWEPITGLPGYLPEGERILWQGAPRWLALARRAFHVRKVIFYFAVVLAGIAIRDYLAGAAVSEALMSGGWVLVLAHVSVGLLLLLAWAMSRSTVYTITNSRVVMRFGVAIPITINLPFSQISSAALKEYPDGYGDIPLVLAGKSRVSYLVLWPHVRPWYFSQVQPMLRAIPEAERVARTLSDALTGTNVQNAANDANGGRREGLSGPASLQSV